MPFDEEYYLRELSPSLVQCGFSQTKEGKNA